MNFGKNNPLSILFNENDKLPLSISSHESVFYFNEI